MTDKLKYMKCILLIILHIIYFEKKLKQPLRLITSIFNSRFEQNGINYVNLFYLYAYSVEKMKIEN